MTCTTLDSVSGTYTRDGTPATLGLSIPAASLAYTFRGVGAAVGVGLALVTLRAGVPVAGWEASSRRLSWRPATKATTATPARSATNPAARRRRREGKVRREVVRGVTGHSLTRPDPTRASRPTAAAQEPPAGQRYLMFVQKV